MSTAQRRRGGDENPPTCGQSRWTPRRWDYLRRVRWERFFEDLEHQLDSEWEAERAALDTEAERLRLARLTLRERLQVLVHDGVEVAIDVVGGTAVAGTVTGVGADWLTLDTAGPRTGGLLVPIAALRSVGLAHPDLLRSARPGPAAPLLPERMTFGFVLRDLVRRRQQVRVHAADGRTFDGTIDRAGADHLDLALHDSGEPRRSTAVTGYRLIPFTAVAWIGIEGDPTRTERIDQVRRT